jgi:hypothetical protein
VRTVVSQTVQRQDDGDEGDEDDLSAEALFDVLGNRRRRFVVHALERADALVELRTLADRIAAWEYGVDPDAVSYEERKCVYTTLQQSHLPRMDDAGVVSFDKHRGVVAPEPALEDVDVYLDVVRGNELPWSEYYVGLAGVAVTALAAAWVGLWPLAAFEGLWVAAATAAAFGVSAVVHAWTERANRVGATEAPPEVQR